MNNSQQLLNRKVRDLDFSEAILSRMLRSIPVKHGKHRLLDRIAPRTWNTSGDLVRVQMLGRDIVIDPYDLVGWHFTMLRSFDPEVVEILEKACNPSTKEVLWDIGANIGACACRLALKVPQLEVVAIEPQASLAPLNIGNLDAVCPGRYEYIQAALGEENAESVLTIPKSNSGQASFHLTHRSPDDRQERVKIITASHIVQHRKVRWPTIAKIDVEGHEFQAFKSLEPCISDRSCKAIVFESHRSDTASFQEIRDMSIFYGYNVFSIRKSPWSTALVQADEHSEAATDYAVISLQVVDGNRSIASLIRS